MGEYVAQASGFLLDGAKRFLLFRARVQPLQRPSKPFGDFVRRVPVGMVAVTLPKIT